MKKIFFSLIAIVATSSLMASVTPHFEIEAGYDHSLAQLRNFNYYGADSYFFENAQMDGFHVGGNVLMDFSEGQHKPGLLIGLNYQFLAKNLMNIHPNYAAKCERYKAKMEAAGATNVVLTDYSFTHTIQLPVRFQYTYQITNNWRFMLMTGPQLRFHAAWTEDQERSAKVDGKKTGYWTSQNYLNGVYSVKEWVNGSVADAYQFDAPDMACLNWFDMSWGFGLGFGWKWLSVNFSYDLGMINIVKNSYVSTVGNFALNSDVLAVTLGFRLK